jgi:hypothetical protein
MGLFDRREPAADSEGGDAQVIDLAEAERKLAARRRSDVGLSNRLGLPTPCPECGQPGYLDHIDLVRKRQFQHCPYCWHKWELDEHQLEEMI